MDITYLVLDLGLVLSVLGATEAEALFRACTCKLPSSI